MRNGFDTTCPNMPGVDCPNLVSTERDYNHDIEESLQCGVSPDDINKDIDLGNERARQIRTLAASATGFCRDAIDGCGTDSYVDAMAAGTPVTLRRTIGLFRPSRFTRTTN